MNSHFIKNLLFLMAAFVLPSHGGEKSQLVTHLEAGHKQVIVTYGTSLTE
jgi:hypothetical protein